jgi:hypothetical protein
LLLRHHVKIGTKSAHNPLWKQFFPKKNAVSAPAKQHQKAASNSIFDISVPARFIYLPEETVSL